MTFDSRSTEPRSDARPAAPAVAERRRAPRCAYRVVVRVAPYHEDNRLPPLAAFQDVETRDLAPGGMSFFMKQAPETRSIVIMLGDPCDPIHLTARVVHCQANAWSDDPEYFVGCEFTGRL